MKLNKVLFGFFAFLLISCDPAAEPLTITNKSKSSVYVFYSCDTTLNDLVLFRNGYYKDSKGDSTYVLSKKYIMKDCTQVIPRRGLNAWTNYINECKSKEIHFYFFLDSIVNYNSDSIIKSKKLYKYHVKYSEKELETQGWRIELF